MAIKIIKHGSKRSVECKNCGCIFSYEQEDISSIKTSINEFTYYIKCPDCKHDVTVDVF